MLKKRNIEDKLYFRNGTIFYLKFPYDEAIIKSLKAIGGGFWNPKGKYWTFDAGPIQSSRLTSLIAYYKFRMHDFREEVLDVEPYKEEEVKSTLYPYSEDYPLLELNGGPRPYQNFAIDYALNRKKFLNADMMGLGKTAESVFAAEIGMTFPCLVVCPSSVKYHWQNFWSTVNPNRSISVIESKETKTRKNNWDADVIIINYDILAERSDKIDPNEKIRGVKPKFPQLIKQEFNCMILDEIHFCKSSKSKRTKVCKKIASKCEYVWGLTGTLVLNRPSEMIAPLQILGVFKSLFGSWNDFAMQFCDLKRTRFGFDVSGASNTRQLNHILRKNCYVRREREEVQKDLPTVQSTIILTDISNRTKYEKAQNDFLSYLESQGEALSFAGNEFLLLRSTLLQLSIAGKLKYIENFLKDFAESTDEKIVIFGVHRDPLIKLSEKFKAPVIMGGVSSLDKQRIVDEFKTSDDRFLFANIKSGGTGTDGIQHAANNVLFIELPDTPALIDQAIARVDRIGQKKLQVNIYFMLGRGTIDLNIKEVLDKKKKVVDAVNKGVDLESIEGFNRMLITSLIDNHKKEE